MLEFLSIEKKFSGFEKEDIFKKGKKLLLLKKDGIKTMQKRS